MRKKQRQIYKKISFFIYILTENIKLFDIS